MEKYTHPHITLSNKFVSVSHYLYSSHHFFVFSVSLLTTTRRTWPVKWPFCGTKVERRKIEEMNQYGL
jgi:hypothetical protein